MEVLLIFLLVIFLIGWWVAVPILFIVFFVKYNSLQNKIKSIYNDGHLSEQNYIDLLGYKAHSQLKRNERSIHKINDMIVDESVLLPKPKNAVQGSASMLKSNAQGTGCPEIGKKAEAAIWGLMCAALPAPHAGDNAKFKSVLLENPAAKDESVDGPKVVSLSFASVTDFETAEACKDSKDEVKATACINAVLPAAAEMTAEHLSVHLENPAECENAEMVQKYVSFEKPHHAEQKNDLVPDNVRANEEKLDLCALQSQEDAGDYSEAKIVEGDPKDTQPADKMSSDAGTKQPDIVSEPKIKHIEKSNHLPIILSIGVILLSTAGFAWITSIWSVSSNFVRLASIASFSVIFFAAFAMAQRVLHIPNSARAFYILGVVSLGTTAVGAEILGVIFRDCALSTQFLFPTGLMAVGMAVGYKIFRTPLFIVLTGGIAYTFLTSLSASVFSSGWMFSVIPAAAATASFVGLRFCKPVIQEKSKVYVHGALIVSIGLAVVSGFAVQSPFESITLLCISIVSYITLLEYARRRYSLALHIGLTAAITWIIYLSEKSFDMAKSADLVVMLSLLTASFVVTRVCAARSLSAASQIIPNGDNKADEKKQSIAVSEVNAFVIGICEAAAVLAVSCIVIYPWGYDYDYAHKLTYSFAAWLVPAFYFYMIGIKNPSSKIQILNLIPTVILFVLSLCFCQTQYCEVLKQSSHEWICYLAYVLPIIGLALLPDRKLWGKSSTRQYYALAVFIAMAIASDKNSMNWYVTSMLCLPGLFSLYAGSRKEELVHKAAFYIPALVFLTIAAVYFMEEVDQNGTFNFVSEPAIWLNAVYVALSFVLAGIPDCKALGRRIDREHFAVLFLIVLGTSTLCHYHDSVPFELVPFVGASALLIHECIWFNRRDVRIFKQLSAALIYVISIVMLFDIAFRSDELFGISFSIGVMFPLLALLLSIPILVEHLVCFKSEKRSYRYLVYAAYCIPSVISIGIILNNDMAHPAASACMLTAAGVICAWCINRREHRRYGIVQAASIYAGLYLLFSTLWPLGEIFGLPYYFNYIFISVVMALMAFFDGYKFKGYTPMRAIWGISAIPLIGVTNDIWHAAHAAGVIILAVNLLQYLTDGGRSVRDRILITVSVGLAAFSIVLKLALLDEQFVYIPTDIRPPLIALIPITASYLISRYLWSFNRVSHLSSFSVLCLAALYLFAIDKYNIFINDIFVSAMALASIAASVLFKYKRYLVFGCFFILMIFFSHTKSFWIDLHWWVYLAVIAAMLITFAVTNEILSRRGSSLLNKVKESKINQWKW